VVFFLVIKCLFDFPSHFLFIVVALFL
jgi:hypothetical protein